MPHWSGHYGRGELGDITREIDRNRYRDDNVQAHPPLIFTNKWGPAASKPRWASSQKRIERVNAKLALPKTGDC